MFLLKELACIDCTSSLQLIQTNTQKKHTNHSRFVITIYRHIYDYSLNDGTLLVRFPEESPRGWYEFMNIPLGCSLDLV